MCDSLYIKSNGELPCWDDVGESLVLRKLNENALKAGEENHLFDFPELIKIRSSFLSGAEPHPEICRECAVRGHGVATSLRPTTIRVLHIEPTYLCQLSCPQCIAPKLRLKIKAPPYYMSLGYYKAILSSLLKDGIESIKFVHFEGRGDPLLNQDLGEMIRHTRQVYPNTFIKVTTHGNYPFSPWMLESGLDLLRLSVDGAFEESYAEYRRGGKLSIALDLMRSIRNQRLRTPSQLRVEWKYILFKWNDSDDEIRRAGQLADELEVDLRFTLTHTDGRSERIQDLAKLRVLLAKHAPNATTSLTFQLKSGPSEASIDRIFAEQAEALLISSLSHYRGGRHHAGRKLLLRALSYDPGLANYELDTCSEYPAVQYLDRIIDDARSPGTLSALANIHLLLEQLEAAERFFQAYLDRSRDAPDRETVKSTRVETLFMVALEKYRAGQTKAGRSYLTKALAHKLDITAEETNDLELAAADTAERLLSDNGSPSVLTTLAHIHLSLKDLESADRFFLAYLNAALGAPDRQAVQAKRTEVLLDLSLRKYLKGEISSGRSYMIEALKHDPGLTSADIANLGQYLGDDLIDRVIPTAKAPNTLNSLAHIHLAAGRLQAAENLFRRYLRDSNRDRLKIYGKLSEAFLLKSLNQYNEGADLSGRALLIKALTFDPGLVKDDLESSGQNPAVEHIDQILQRTQSPSTLSALANIHLVLAEWEASERFFKGYLGLAPKASDRAKIEQLIIELSVNNRLGCALEQATNIETSRVIRAELATLEIDPGFSGSVLRRSGSRPTCALLPRIIDRSRYPSTLFKLAQLCAIRGDLTSTEALFERYLTLKPSVDEEVERARLDALRNDDFLRSD